MADNRGHYNEGLKEAFDSAGRGIKKAVTPPSGGAFSGLEVGRSPVLDRAGRAIKSGAKQALDAVTPSTSVQVGNRTVGRQTPGAASLSKANNRPAAWDNPSPRPTGVLRSNAGASTSPANTPSPRPGTNSVLRNDGTRGGTSTSRAVSRGTGIPGIKEDITGAPGSPRSFYNDAARSGKPATSSLMSGADNAGIQDQLSRMAALRNQYGGGGGGGGGRAVLIGDNRESDLQRAIKDAISRSRPRGTDRGSLLKAKNAQRELAQLSDLYGADVSAETSRGNTALATDGALQQQMMRNQGALTQQQVADQAAVARLAQEDSLQRGRLQFEEMLPSTRAGVLRDQSYADYYANRGDIDVANADAQRSFEEQQGALDRAAKFMGSDSFLALDEPQQQWLLSQQGLLPPVEGRANGGFIEPMTNNGVLGFAEGGPIDFNAAPDMAEIDPAVREYAQYVSTAAKHKLQPIPLSRFVDLMDAGRQKLQSAPTAGGTQGFADGGVIPVAGRQVMDATGTPDMTGGDDIPAVIDGQRPAALTSGEFVIPAEVVKAKGTEFFEKMIAQYMQQTGE